MTEVLKVTEGTVVIRSGDYDITFKKTPAGVKKASFIYHNERMENSFIPYEIFNPAALRARSIFHSMTRARTA